MGPSARRRATALHRPLHEQLLELWERYRRPLLLSETGAEAQAGPGWLGYVCAEVRQAMRLGVSCCRVLPVPGLGLPRLGRRPALPMRPDRNLEGLAKQDASCFCRRRVACAAIGFRRTGITTACYPSEAKNFMSSPLRRLAFYI